MSLIGVTAAVAMLLVAESSTGTGAQVTKDWLACTSKCSCKWVSGRKYAECANLSHIPVNLSPEIQSVVLSKNKFVSLPANAFKEVGLVHLHKLNLRECQIQDIHKDAFSGLQILIELDLSKNDILTLHPDTFRDNIRLRLLILNENPINTLEDGLFTNLTHLQSIELKQCNLSLIGNQTFVNLPNLHLLSIEGNQLSHLQLSVVEKLVKLRSLDLHNNPWKCDCHLRELRDWIIEKNLYVQPTSCAKPEYFENKFWTDITSQEFACKPQIKYPPSDTKIKASGEDVTLSCQVTGNPLPEVSWVFNSRIISNNTRIKYGGLRYTITLSGETYRWVNITINRVRVADRGEFRCVARSLGGVDERVMTLLVDSSDKDGYYNYSSSDSLPLVIGFTTGVLALLIIAFVICCCLCRKCHNDSLAPLHHHGKKSTGNGFPPNGEIVGHVSSSSDQEKSLLAINPVQKPPRRYESQISPTIGGDISELNRNLLDDGSLIAAGGGDDERSLESIEEIPLKSRDKRDSEYPPDLIAFPGKGRQNNASPAGSSTSTALPGDGTPGSRHPLVGSPPPILHSPLFHQFGTLPYARAGSPYSVSGLGSTCKQGYVTIPRRPRVPSWTGNGPPTACLLDQLADQPQPVYDNLGPRTTADGSSVLSLNKTGIEVGTQPRRRLAQEPPNYLQGRPFSPLSPPSLIPEELRRWGIGVNPLRRSGSADGPLIPLQSSHHLTAGVKPKVAPKVAPKPPPKPVKVVTSGQPLYEDEGEDGTEV